MDHVQNPQKSLEKRGKIDMPDTHRVLLKTMLQYEIDNFLRPKLNEIDEDPSVVSEVEEQELYNAFHYLCGRIQALDE